MGRRTKRSKIHQKSESAPERHGSGSERSGCKPPIVAACWPAPDAKLSISIDQERKSAKKKRRAEKRRSQKEHKRNRACTPCVKSVPPSQAWVQRSVTSVVTSQIFTVEI